MKRTRKLLAMLMALAMVLSCGMSALAITTKSGGESTQSGGNFSNNDGEQRRVVSTVQMESKRPDDVIRLVLPTISYSSTSADDFTANTFDMILDPHDLIQASVKGGAQRIDAEFKDGTYVYFKTKDTGGGKNGDKPVYSANSQELTIINKSNVAVGVGLTAIVNRPDSEDNYKLGAETFKLRTSPTEDSPFSTTEPEMVLALVSGATTEEITTPTTIGAPTFPITDVAQGLVNSVKFEFANDLTEAYKKAVNEAINGKTFTLTPTVGSGDSLANVNKVVATTSITSGDGLELDSNTLSVNAATWDSTNGMVAITSGDLTLPITVKSTADLQDDDSNALAAKTVGTITVKLDNAAVQAQLADSTTITAGELTAAAWTLADSETKNIPSALDLLKDSYVTKYDSTGKAYAYEMVAGLTDDDFESVSFHLSAKINGDGDMWDELITEAEAGKTHLVNIEVIWDVTPFAGTASELATLAPAKAPSASVAQKAESATGGVKIAYDLGRKDLAATGVSKVTYVASGKDVTISKDNANSSDGVWAFKSTSAIYSAGKVKVTFNDAKATVVELTIK